MCGGISRFGEVLQELFQTIDVYDLKPNWGNIPINQRGKLITANLKDIKKHLNANYYDCLWGTWALCYINLEDVDKVLAMLFTALKEDGVLVLKEPILNKNRRETIPRICWTGQNMVVRSAAEIEKRLLKNFVIYRYKDIKQREGYDT